MFYKITIIIILCAFNVLINNVQLEILAGIKCGG